MNLKIVKTNRNNDILMNTDNTAYNYQNPNLILIVNQGINQTSVENQGIDYQIPIVSNPNQISNLIPIETMINQVPPTKLIEQINTITQNDQRIQ